MPQLRHRSQLRLGFKSLAWELPFAEGVAIKKKKDLLDSGATTVNRTEQMVPDSRCLFSIVRDREEGNSAKKEMGDDQKRPL